MLAVYFEALVDYETRDIEAGIHDMLSGRVDGFNPSFLPPAPLVAKSVRAALHNRLNAERLDRLALPPPADDFEQDPPEVRAKNKARLETLAASLASSMRTDEAEGSRVRQQIASKTNQRFAPSYDPDDMAKRLGLRVTTFNSADDDNHDMGGERVA